MNEFVIKYMESNMEKQKKKQQKGKEIGTGC